MQKTDSAHRESNLLPYYVVGYCAAKPKPWDLIQTTVWCEIIFQQEF
jgi:hypothetical protein